MPKKGIDKTKQLLTKISDLEFACNVHQKESDRKTQVIQQMQAAYELGCDSIAKKVEEVEKNVNADKEKIQILEATVKDQETTIVRLENMVRGRGNEIDALRHVISLRDDRIRQLEVARYKDGMGA